MKITDAFLGEHGVFYALFDEFARVLEGDDLSCVKQRASLLAAGLAPHAQLEDELLFDVLAAHPLGGTGVLALMREEHRQIEAALQAVQRATDLTRAREMLREVMDLARDHFLKEELVAFPLAEELLTLTELEAAGSRWAAMRGVRLSMPAFTKSSLTAANAAVKLPFC